VNQIGESILSASNTVIFANLPLAPASLTLTSTASPAQIVASWTAPNQVNGDAIDGYNVYVDDGFGGPFSLVFAGPTQANMYQSTITGLTCGLRYSVQITAINSAGEGPSVVQSIYLGNAPSAPLYPSVISITP
jgi:hypothetical protein